MVLNAVFGGGLTSKLFLHVREKLSLCYYASSSVYGAKGILTVSSGIETCNYQQAKEEILRQLAACQAGEITQEELQAAQEAICSGLRTIPDAPGRMEDYALFCLLSQMCIRDRVYTANFLEARGKGGRVYGRRSGVCLETQFYPDSSNHPQWPSPLVRAGEEKTSVTELVFGLC